MNNAYTNVIQIKEIIGERDNTTDKEYYHGICHLWNIFFEVQQNQISKDKQSAGYSHCIAVEENIGKILLHLEKKHRLSFNLTELYLLSAAACVHDAGKSGVFKENHALVAMHDLLHDPKKYELSAPLSRVLSIIVGSHDIDEVFDETEELDCVGNIDVRPRLLSAILRLADVLHTDNTRIPHIIVDKEEKESDKTRFRRLVHGWYIDVNDNIVLRVQPENSEDINIISIGVQMMKKQIKNITPYLRIIGCPYNIIYSCDDRLLNKNIKSIAKRKILEMDYYTEDDEDLFKGRDTEIIDLSSKIIGSKITLLIGNSGTGKTSIIRAGLFPYFNNLGWRCIWTRPINPEPSRCIIRDIKTKIPEIESNDLSSIVKQLNGNINKGTLLVIDQFEDIIRSPPSEQESLLNFLLGIHSRPCRNLHILLAYRADFEAEINYLLDKSSIVNSARMSLLELNIATARNIFKFILETNEVKISNDVLINILEDLQRNSQSNRIYPPYIQILAFSLINGMKNSEITLESFYNNYKSTDMVISNYLINRLDALGDKNSPLRIHAEKILKELVQGGVKDKRNKSDLKQYTSISDEELQGLLDKLVKMRLIRHLGNDNYEIIHDYMATRIEEIMSDDERQFKNVRDILRMKTLHYKNGSKPLLLDYSELISFAKYREIFKPNDDEKELILYSFLVNGGPIWWLFKDDLEYVKRVAIKIFSSDTPRINIEAIEILYLIEPIQYIQTIKYLLKNQDSNLRTSVMDVVSNLRVHEVKPQIIDLFKDRDRSVRNKAVRVIGKLGIQDALPKIEDMLNDSDGGVRRNIVRVIGELCIQEALPKIEEMLDDPDSFVRSSAVDTIGKLGGREALPKIEVMLNSSDSEVRSSAVDTIGKLGAPDALPLIIELLSDPDADVRCSVVDTIGKLGGREALPKIKVMLSDPDSVVRSSAVDVIGELGTQDDLPDIQQMLSDPDSYVRRSAVDVVGKLGDIGALPIIIELLDSSDSDVRSSALNVIGKLGAIEALQKIEMMLNDSESDVRNSAVRAIGELGVQEALPIIKKMLNDPDDFVRRSAVRVIGKIGNQNDLPDIIKMLNDSETYTLRTVVEVIGELGVHEGLPQFIDMLNSQEWTIRSSAYRVIEKYGTIEIFWIIVDKFVTREIENNEIIYCIKSLDKKLFKPCFIIPEL